MAKRNANGMGTVTKRKDGRWQAAVYVPQPDGTEKRKFVYGKTREEVEDKRRELVDRARSGIPLPTRSPRLCEWLPLWLEEIVKPQRKKGTYSKYESLIRLYLVPMLGTKRLESLSVADVRKFLAAHAAQVSAATARESHAVLRSALSAACREELIARNVATLVKPPRVQRRVYDPWTIEETLIFLRAARRDPAYAGVLLAIALGLRRGEIVGLKWSQVDFTTNTLRLGKQLQRRNGELYEDTTKGRPRTMPLPLICLIALRWQRWRWLALREEAGSEWVANDYVFVTRSGRPIEGRNLYRSFLRLSQSAGVRTVRLHDARHGFATLMADSGVEPRLLMELMGHSQIAVTMNVYTHVVQKSKREAIKTIDRLLRPERPRKSRD
jgi:integrase